ADKRFMIWDTRNDREKPAYNIIAHEKAVNALAFNPHNEHVVATGSVDMNVSLWDLRNLKYKLHMMEYHKDEILCLKWAPFDETILASSSGDRRVCIWDLSRIGEDQTAEDAEEGPSELLFVHGGHTDRVRDFSWNPHTQWVIASVADDNIMQIWQPSNSIVTTEDLDP
ncbi:2848_t:CDS:2, partial [Paraglomus occultum]